MLKITLRDKGLSQNGNLLEYFPEQSDNFSKTMSNINEIIDTWFNLDTELTEEALTQLQNLSVGNVPSEQLTETMNSIVAVVSAATPVIRKDWTDAISKIENAFAKGNTEMSNLFSGTLTHDELLKVLPKAVHIIVTTEEEMVRILHNAEVQVDAVERKAEHDAVEEAAPLLTTDPTT